MNRQAVLACRVREIRQKLYGEDRVKILANALQIPALTWLNYERGVATPAHILLKFLEITGVVPAILLRADGDEFRDLVDE